MSEQGKHTPGPWTWFTGFKANTSETLREPGDCMRYVMGGPLDQGLAHTVGLNEETDTANAHLIAAAPDLLRAAKEARAALQEFITEEPASEWMAVALLDHAIAKAEGRT